MPRKTESDNKIGRWGAISYVMGNIVGAGIFVAPTTISNQVGSAGMSLIIWLLSAAICTAGSFCYLELGTIVKRSGGDFAYLCFVKWKCIAFMFMVTGCVIVYPMQLAIAAGASGAYIVQGLGLASSEPHAYWLGKLFGFSIVWLILFLNFFSIRRVGAPFQMVSSLAKLVACALVIGIGAVQVLWKGSRTNNIDDFFANSTLAPGHVAAALFGGFYSYDGWDILNWGAEEIRNPERTMPFAILGGMTSVALLYTAMNCAYFTVLSADEMRMSNAVAMTFIERIVGQQVAQWTIPLLINLVLLGSINGTMFIASRYLFAAARERQLPSFLACVNERHESPRAALFVHVLLAFAFSFVGNTEQLIVSMGFAQWLHRCFTLAALLYIRLYGFCPSEEGNADSSSSSSSSSAAVDVSSSVRSPLVLPILFLAICAALVAITLVKEFSDAYIALIVLTLAAIVYVLFVYERGLSRFEWYRQRAEQINESLCRLTQVVFDGRIEVF